MQHNLKERELYLLNLIGLREKDLTEEILILIRQALAFYNYYVDAAQYVLERLKCN